MSINSPFYKRAVEEADFLRDRLVKLQDRLSDEPNMGDTHVDYLHTLYALIDKEHSIFTRLKLIDTVESHLAIRKLDAYKIVDLIHADDVDINNVYPIVKSELIDLIKQVSGEDWHPEDFDIEDDA